MVQDNKIENKETGDRMKVLFIVNWYTPKSEKTLQAGVFHYEQCIALQKYTDIRLYWPFDTEAETLESGMENGLYVYRSPMKGNKITRRMHLYAFFERVIQEYQPDIIHANCANYSGYISAKLGEKYHIPVILTEHTPIEAMGLENSKNQKIYHYAYTHAVNICVSTDSMERLKKCFPDADFQVNYNGIINPSELTFEKKEYKRPDAVNCAIIAGFYSKDIKGYQYLIPAVKKVNDKGIPVVLHIVGGGQYEEYYRNFAKEIGADKYCIFYGQCNRERVYSIASQMDFCISASIYECSGVSVQEEMLLGKPVLVTRSGGANSLTTEDTAIVVDRNSTEALVNGLEEMAKRYKEFDAEKIQQYAIQNFEIAHVTESIMRSIRKLLKKEHKEKSDETSVHKYCRI
jgi:glycosyltransferase involved in cell wall biosynthesis